LLTFEAVSAEEATGAGATGVVGLATGVAGDEAAGATGDEPTRAAGDGVTGVREAGAVEEKQVFRLTCGLSCY
jgi:hypothetical protein